MTLNEELRRMLDERGVEWKNVRREVKPRLFIAETEFCVNGVRMSYVEFVDNSFLMCNHLNITPERAIAVTLGPAVTGDTSDGFHTFNELYHHRAVLFSVIVRDHTDLAWKSKAHSDGSMYDGMFIVGIETPDGQATYHYDLDPHWDMFECKELDRAPEWDGHTPDDAIARIATLGAGKCKNTAPSYLDFLCSECGFVYYRNDENYSGGNDWHYCPNCGKRVIG